MTNTSIFKLQVTTSLYNLFVTIVNINERCFRGCSITDVINRLSDIADIDDSLYIKSTLKDMISNYCDYHDTGIYY